MANRPKLLSSCRTVNELWELATSAHVLPLTILLIPVALYWIMNVIGVIDLDFFSINLDPGGDAADAGLGDDAAHHGILGVTFQGMLRVVNATKVPLMVVLSILIILLWGFAMLGNHYFNPNGSGFLGGLVSIAALVLSIPASRLVTMPLIPLFEALRGDVDSHLPVIGRPGIVRTAEVTETSGQAEVEDLGTPLLLNVRVGPGQPVVPRGTKIIICRHEPQSGTYLVRRLEEIPDSLINPK